MPHACRPSELPYAWYKDRRFKNKGNMVNFIAKFDIDEGTTQLSLELSDYDISPDAEYDSWLLLEPKETD